MTDWTALFDELERWRRAGRTATFWWRDDDSEPEDRGIERLLALQRERRVPLSIAVIPAAADETFAGAIARETGVWVLQHGYAHRNHATVGDRKCEFSSNRDKQEVLDELMAGKSRLRELFGDRFLPVLVPPWNRIYDAWIHELPELGYRGLSRATPRTVGFAAAGLRAVNIHVDITDWRGTRGFIGVSRALRQVLRHLQARRADTVDAREPTGLLTHHLVADATAWEFVAELIDRTGGHQAVEWMGAPRLF